MLIEPAAMNDARLFTLESRIHNEENARCREYEYLRDFLKKMVYTFEQDTEA